ncbi:MULTISPECIES: efflux RND transporter periplasmic adaptor subunit [Bradyrhizobium]|jgi:membrane fusion protein, heavy metal efflux system|uniref:efflux RND transporter periplasmic adaptor subunit n=1 Tax=Bradyrhizobium TaxID=374 RepID=UPI00048223B9|nr:MULTISPECIES: efflux RND transporter periplasmic adaptor subunit [Bradyrhizobium]MCS3445789.1 cobalt-zinc-cadmium efflux system membrane fusion protein [Bradyrhizobium elkanii]MCS3563080.1 cobalt-zinc-cadmium efflux system membrane fusion protein [Bradyrhizobium elkanii]MCW2147085.1 cobalt-zinc-cadmium efflux system membrane fusion protein [Bradyrhizobium elkanii]MCW2353840.1 cobalt-zinc-cadmium efflux system membrane fusion protein [Bradyrhizobium elkanii]MCW2379915.1 cobalt-zinc-cadmium e
MPSRTSVWMLGLAVIVAAAALAAWGPGMPALRRTVGLAATVPSPHLKPQAEERKPVVRMDDERIALAKIEQAKAGPATMAMRLSVPAVIAPDADRVAHVSVKLSGTVAELRKNIGDEVEKGQVLGALESREVADAKSEYMAARLSNDLQQDLAARDKAAWDTKAVPEQQYIRSRNAAAQTAMRLDIARQKLLALGMDESEIVSIPQAPEGTLRLQNVRSPISGRVVERKVELGTAVGRDNLETELFVIVDLSRVWVEMAVNSSDLPMVREGQSVSVTSRGSSGTGTGKIIFVSPLLDKETRAARAVAVLDNPDRRWRPGSFVTAEIAVESRQAPIAVPATAVQTVEGHKAVFVRTPEGFEKRDIVLGRRDGDLVEVTSGLTAGETIAVSNTFPLKAELSKPGDED